MKPNPNNVDNLDLSYLEWRDGKDSSINSTSHLTDVRAGRRPTRTSGVGNGMSRGNK